MKLFQALVMLLVLGKKPSIASDCSGKKNNTRNNWEFVMNSLLPDEYNSEESPSVNNEPIVINVTFTFWSLSGVSIPKQVIEVEFGVVASWRDDRLLEMAPPYSKRKRIPVPQTVVEDLWRPYVYYVGCRFCEGRDDLFRGKSTQLHYLPQEKTFQVVYGETKAFICSFNLQYYPFDSHQCIIGLQFIDDTFNNVTAKLRHVELDWVTNVPESHLTLFGAPPEFAYDVLSLDDTCHFQDGSDDAPDVVDNAKKGGHCLTYTVRIHRRIGHHMILVYLPTMMIVTASWVSFWLEANNPAPRVTLGMTTLLTLTGIFSTSQQGLAQVSYVKALDVWIIACIFIVFASLIEFAYVFHTRHLVTAAIVQPISEELIKLPSKNNASEVITELSTTVQKPHLKHGGTRAETKAHWMDVASRYVFPATFALFNILYWCICCFFFG